MLQRNSSQPCYYVCLSPLLVVMRTGSQRRINLSENLFCGSRPRYMYILQGMVVFFPLAKEHSINACCFSQLCLLTSIWARLCGAKERQL